MKIKLAILEKDQSYLARIVSVFNAKYTDKFEVYSFTDMDYALAYLEDAKIDVFVANDIFDIDVKNIPGRCGFAYLVDSADIEKENGQKAIFKFQKVGLIYKQILSIYAEKATSISGLKLGEDSTRIIVFNSVSGGAGSSTIAASAARHFAALGKKTLYLNLEKFGSADLFFHAEGQFDMSDIIYALKSRRANLALKLESCVKQDYSGVYFYSQSKIALDMLELNMEETMRLVSELKVTGSYDYICIDTDFAMNQETLKLYRQAHAVVWTAEGTEISNAKIYRAYTALSIMEQNAESPLINRLCIVYNKFSSKTGKTITEGNVKIIGGAPMFMQASTEQILEEISKLPLFDKLI